MTVDSHSWVTKADAEEKASPKDGGGQRASRVLRPLKQTTDGAKGHTVGEIARIAQKLRVVLRRQTFPGLSLHSNRAVVNEKWKMRKTSLPRVWRHSDASKKLQDDHASSASASRISDK